LIAIVGLGFLAAVLVPGLQLATQLASSTTAIRFVGQQQRQAAMLRASLEAMPERLAARGYGQASIEQLKEADGKLSAAISQMTAPRAGGLTWLTGLTGQSD